MPGGSSAWRARYFPIAIVTWWFGSTLKAHHGPLAGDPLPRAVPTSGDALLAAHMHFLATGIYVLPYTATMSIQCLILLSIPHTCPEAKHCLFSHRAAVTLLYIFKLMHLWCSKENQKQASRICVWRAICSWNSDPMLYFTTRSPNPPKRQIQTLSEIHSLGVWSTTCLLLKENTPENNFILKMLTISRQDKFILPKFIADGT